MNATNKQIGGSHYKDMPIQPVEFIHKNGIPYIEGSVIKYVSRWRKKGGVEDLKKARHFLDLLIEMEEAKETIDPLWGGEDYTNPEHAWPEKYEVGMRFERNDGQIAKCVRVNDNYGIITTPTRGWHCHETGETVYGYTHGWKCATGFSDGDDNALAKYLGKD